MKYIYTAFLVLCYSLVSSQTKLIQYMTRVPDASHFINYKTDIWQNKVFYKSQGYLMYFDGINLPKVVKKTNDNAFYSNQFKSTTNWMYFTDKNPTTNLIELWRTDGTDANTIKLDEATSIIINQVGSGYSYQTAILYDSELNGQFFYFKNNSLYKTDGSVSTLIKSNLYRQGTYFICNNAFYFYNYNSSTNTEHGIYKYDGAVLENIYPVVMDYTVVANSISYLLGKFGNKILFAGIYNKVKGFYSIDTVTGSVVLELPTEYLSDADWNNVSGSISKDGIYLKLSVTKNNATTYGIYRFGADGLIKIIDTYDLNVKQFVCNDNLIYLVYTKNSESNTSLYFRKMTLSGNLISESRIKDISNMNTSAKFGFFRDSYWFQYSLPNIADFELWRTDGTNENTVQVQNIDESQNMSSGPTNFFVLNDRLYFFGSKSYMPCLYEFAGDFTFNNNKQDNNWNNKENWNSLLLPSSVDDANIPNSQNLQINGSAFAKNLNVSSPIDISSGSLNISGNIDLGAKITLNGNNLNLKGSDSKITNANSTNYIITNGTGTVNVENLDAARGTVNLPIGTATNYNPISISNSGTSDTFSARVSDGIQNTTNGAVNSTWEISEATAGGSNVNVTLGWNASQENSSFSRNSAKVGHYLNGTWNEENSGSVSGTDSFTISATGITSFSPFSVMNFGALAANNISKNQVSVYPNPFSDNLNISTDENASIYLYDLSGKLISKEFLVKGSNSLNKSSLQKGIYFYQIKGKDGNMVSSGKIIKK
ncbi:T9SS type A sorting domain-containing protein [Chryseobacterium suipulveris]|uniref:T9SS type A sorting domain-containing protein n=1 Tax=Chryseobacterium suipulveris TaxID=2929800 RepID=A0ABY4BKR5_9FLAO|nr:T9SS type A sorting domain-containing protein [Chryseobacterium suipulveris]UOE39769.1 T9SS type A sorting domain-containing protein [Chryseobacterium suipulveris]